MRNMLSCAQVVALLSFFSENKLNPILKSSIEDHLRNCKHCRKIYSVNGATLNNEAKEMYESYDDWEESMSAYVDNELSDKDSVKMRKITITNPIARKKLENMYKLKQDTYNYFNKLKNDCKIDYSKDVINILCGEKSSNSFNRLVWAFTAMLSVILAGFIAMLYL